MILEIENQSTIIDVSEKVLIKKLKNLRSYGPSSFASLTNDNGSYVQLAGGGVTCMIEHFDSVMKIRKRAFHDFSSTQFSDGTRLVFGGGDIALKKDEWFNIEQSISIFTSFLGEKKFPENISWR